MSVHGRAHRLGPLAGDLRPRVVVVAVIAIALYARSITLGASWTKCFVRRPTLIIGFWAAVAIADAWWLFGMGGRWPA